MTATSRNNNNERLIEWCLLVARERVHTRATKSHLLQQYNATATVFAYNVHCNLYYNNGSKYPPPNGVFPRLRSLFHAFTRIGTRRFSFRIYLCKRLQGEPLRFLVFPAYARDLLADTPWHTLYVCVHFFI